MKIFQDTSNRNWADTSPERDKYFKNAVKSLTNNMSIFEDFNLVEFSQSPFSFSCYLYLYKESNDCIWAIKLRISDHPAPSYDPCTTDFIESRFGFFEIKKNYFEKLKKWGIVDNER